MDKKKRSGNITEEQRNLLIEFMKVHPELVSGKFSKTFTYDHAAKLWQKVTEILNACNGAEKNWKSWRKCWQDYRSRSKTKQAEINTERRKTGGGTWCNTVLTPEEEQVLSLVPASLIKSHADVLESGTDMILNEDEDNSNDMPIETKDLQFLEEDYNDIEKSGTASTVQATETFSNDENIDPSMLTKRKKSSSRNKVIEVKDSTRVLAEVAEKNYLLKEKFYEESIQYRQRMAIAQERMATVAEKIATERCKVM